MDSNTIRSGHTQQFGAKLIKEYGEGSLAEIGEYTISRDGLGHIDSYQVFGNTPHALRKIAGEVQVCTVDDWTTCLPQTPFDSARFMPKHTTKAKMQEILYR
ncbi:MAG: hypothetical protein HDS92_02085 [Bacteroidales bacterium]|nr:hypothetical protein [Bacteroidales bacterium]